MAKNHNRKKFRLSPLLVACLATGSLYSHAVEVVGFNPQVNDNKVGSTIVSGGNTVALTTVNNDVSQSFETGDSGARDTTLQALKEGGQLLGDAASLIEAERLNIGTQTSAVSIPDPITGGKITVQTYSNDNIKEMDPYGYATHVSDIVNVSTNPDGTQNSGMQYINTQIARVEATGGTLNVSLGTSDADKTSATNKLDLAAKQSTLFVADGTDTGRSIINWNSSNRITFTSVAPELPDSKRFYGFNFVEYKGPLSVTTVDGATRQFNVTNADTLREYNGWLIEQLESGNLAGSDYTANFNKAVAITSDTFDYKISAVAPDEATLPLDPRIVINAKGANAKVNITSGNTLEAVNAHGGAIVMEDGAKLNIENGGTVSSQYGVAVTLKGQGTEGVNDGVINGNFAMNGTTPSSLQWSNDGVVVKEGSKFTNNGILNIASNNTEAKLTSGINLDGTATATATATNTGIINIGIVKSSSNGGTVGAIVNGVNASFTNTATGEIYIGRGYQNDKSVTPTDIALNQKMTTAGIQVLNNGTAINEGKITIGKLTQNAAGMIADGGADTVMENKGEITINGNAAKVPNLNYGMLVKNAGSGGNIVNEGIINLEGVNAIGIKVLSEGAINAKAISTNTGKINIDGNASPDNGTRNYGVWVEGKGIGLATADIDSEIILAGTGAIGVHARGNSVINLAADAVPEFKTGSNQIGFFAYGDKAKINVLGTNKLSVDTRGSHLFRVEDGADFDGENLTIDANGLKSLGVMASGKGTLMVSNNGIFTLNGQESVGFYVEGGAKGTIDSATTLNLKGVGSTAAIVDGQKHNLAGKASGNPVKTTTLDTAAILNNNVRDLTGYIARNQAILTNTGNINFTGDGGIGIQVESGATANNKGDIAINNAGIGIIINSGTSNLNTVANNHNNITVNGGSVDSRTIGIFAAGKKAIANIKDNAEIKLNGAGAIGAIAASGGVINITDTAKVTFNNKDQVGYYATGTGSKVTSSAAASDVSTEGSTLYRIDDSASLILAGGSELTASGKKSTAIVGSGKGTIITASDTKINVSGDGASGVKIDGGATGTLGKTSEINITAVNGIGGIVDAVDSTLSGTDGASVKPTTLINQGKVTGNAASITGFVAKRGGTLVNEGAVNLTGQNNTGILLQAATVKNTGTIDVAHGTGIRVDGSRISSLVAGKVNVNDGTAGIQVQNGAQLNLTGTSSNITTNGTAHGILLSKDANSLMAIGTTLNVLGTGNGLENAAEISSVLFNNVTINVNNGAGIRTATAISPNSRVDINVSGSGTGFAFRKADGSQTTSDLVLGEDYKITGTGAGAKGIEALTTGNVLLQSNVNIEHANGGSALIAGTAKSTLNQGTLQSKSTTAPVVDLSNGNGTEFVNEGEVLASSSKATAIKGSAGNDSIYLTNGMIRGDIATGAGSDKFLWDAGDLDGSLTMGAGNNNSATIGMVNLDKTTHLTAGTGTSNNLTFSSTAGRGGSFAQDNLARGVNLGTGWSTINFTNGTSFRLVDNLKLSHSDVNIDRSSILYTGNNVNPTISGGSANSVTLTNAGVVDMTSESGVVGNRLTIAGNNVGSNGHYFMGTTLNEGGNFSNQFTDRLLVEGNASGTNLLDVIITPDSTGKLTDLNHTGTIEPLEGISLVQVAGQSTESTYALKDGYVAGGPWSYVLYSFAPGESDEGQREVKGSGNNFWDYRLANSFACGAGTGVVCNKLGNQVGETRPAVVPQVPSYVSGNLGSAFYNNYLMDDLHKRLGEIRHQQILKEGEDNNVFVRYIGANIDYESNLGFKKFGYDFDLDINAVQLGVNFLDMDDENNNNLHAGLAYTRGHTRIKPKAVDGGSRTNFDNDTVALYVTKQNTEGFYTDGVLFGGLSKGDVSTTSRGGMGSLRGHNLGASVEVGYPIDLGNKLELEPQAQLMYQRVHFKDMIDRDNNRVHFEDYSQTTARLGARLDKTYITEKGHKYTPYARANYIFGWGNKPKVGISSVVGDISHTFTGGKQGQSAEVGIGGTSSFNNGVSLYGEVDYRESITSYGAKGLRYNVGVRWTFE